MLAEQWAIYWWSIAENISCFLASVGVASLLLGPLIGSLLLSDSTTDKYGAPVIFNGVIVGLISILLAVFVPSKQDLALIFAYPYMKAGVEQAAQSETVKKLTTISTKYLDKVIADLEKTNDYQ